jgi:hypothetical protein
MNSRWTIAMLSACIGVSVLAAQQARPPAGVPAYEVAAGWLKIPEWRKETRGWDSTNEIGSMHGDVAVSSTGDVYVSVEGTAR